MTVEDIHIQLPGSKKFIHFPTDKIHQTSFLVLSENTAFAHLGHIMYDSTVFSSMFDISIFKHESSVSPEWLCDCGSFFFPIYQHRWLP